MEARNTGMWEAGPQGRDTYKELVMCTQFMDGGYLWNTGSDIRKDNLIWAYGALQYAEQSNRSSEAFKYKTNLYKNLI